MNGTPILPIDPAQLEKNDSCGMLFDFYRPWLLRVAVSGIDATLRTKLSASDLVQKTFLRAWQCLHQFEGKSTGELRGWLATIMKHQLADSIRRFHSAEKRDVFREVPHLNWDHHPARDATEWPCSELIERMITAIEELPEVERDIVRKRYLEQQSFESIAATCNMSRERVRRRWLRAIEQLADRLNTDRTMDGS